MGHLVFEPQAGQRCNGRNYEGRRCCTPENPCDEGEGDCDGPASGGDHDGHEGCKGELLCGNNNCKQFGAYYHGSDDCCERPQSPAPSSTRTAAAFDLHHTRPVGPGLAVAHATASHAGGGHNQVSLGSRLRVSAAALDSTVVRPVKVGGAARKQSLFFGKLQGGTYGNLGAQFTARAVSFRVATDTASE